MKRLASTLVLLLVTTSGDAASEAVTPDPVAGGEDQLFATADEVQDGKALASSACAHCHGLNGISAIEELPHLAGQRVDYLYRELLAYKEGAREDRSMQDAVKFLSEDALKRASAYYASLDPPMNVGMRLVTGVGTNGAPTATPAADPVETGKAASAACAGCHGATGNSIIPGMPSLTGQHPKYLTAAIKAYQEAGRAHDMMKSAVASLSDADIENMALYYALQEPEPAATPGVGDVAEGQSAAAACSGCHGEDGNSADPLTPSLAGQDAQYLVNATKLYQDGRRDHATMKSLVVALSNSEIDNLSAFYASQEPKPRAVRKPLTTVELAQRCDRCHGIDGNSIDPRSPSLAGQRQDYLEMALHKYQSGARDSPMMHAMSEPLGEREINNIAAHYASKQAKAVIFVKVPCDCD